MASCTPFPPPCGRQLEARAIREFVAHCLAPNLHNAGENQSDASFGFTAAVAESLLQSHDGEIHLLPALSAEWKNGSVRGLRARGGYEVSMEWKNGELLYAVIRNINGHSGCRVRYGSKTVLLSVRPGASQGVEGALFKGLVAFSPNRRAR